MRDSRAPHAQTAPAESVQVLVDIANLRGGPDNITVIVVRVGSLADLPRTPKSIAAGPGGATPPTNPLPWIVFGVLGLITLALLVTQQTTAALASGAAALVAAGNAALKNTGECCGNVICLILCLKFV